MAVKNAIYQVDNGSGFDEIHFKTKAKMVFLPDGRTLEEFMNNGGTINGPLRVGGTNPLTLYQMKSISAGDVIWSDDIYPNTRGEETLGNLEWTWKDIFLSGVGAGQTGYTKLPNGFILQWGLTDIPIPPTDKEALAINVTLPVTFPTKNLVTWGQVVNLVSQSGGAYKASFYSVISNVVDRSTLWLYARTSNVSILTPSDTALKVYWFALGH